MNGSPLSSASGPWPHQATRQGCDVGRLANEGAAEAVPSEPTGLGEAAVAGVWLAGSVEGGGVVD
jgi:hypothetical protein